MKLATEGDAVLKEYYDSAVHFAPDIIVRIGENINRETNKKINCKPFFASMIKHFIAPNTRCVCQLKNT